MKDLRLNNNHFSSNTHSRDDLNRLNSIYSKGLKNNTRIIESAQLIDFRNEIDFQFNEVGQDELEETNEYMYEIAAYLNGKEIGFMNFTVNFGKEDPDLDELFIKLVEINDDMQGLGIGQLLYKKFGEIYADEFNEIPVNRYFVNPIAEYSFRKAVSLGWIPQSVLDENRIKRDYSKDNGDQLWTDLRNKLPEQYRGAQMNTTDLRKKA